MSTSGETADLVVKESIQITESAVKLAGLGAKNLAALLVALAKDNPKLAGKTGLKRLIQDGEELTIFSVKQEDLKGFQMESKRYGVLFYGTPWKKPSVERRHSLHTALTLLCRMNFPLRKTSLLQGNFYWRTL